MTRCDRCGKRIFMLDVKEGYTKEGNKLFLCNNCYQKEKEQIKEIKEHIIQEEQRKRNEELQKKEEEHKKLLEEFSREHKIKRVEKIESDYGENRIIYLEAIAFILLFIFVILGFIIFIALGSTEVQTGYYTSKSVPNPIGIASGLGFILGGIIIYFLFNVIASIGRNLIEIRKNTEKKK